MSQWLINAEGWQFSNVPLMNKIYSIYVVNESWATFHGSAGQKIRQMNLTQPWNKSCEIRGAIDIWDIWCQFLGALSQNHQQHYQKQVCDAPRDQLANPGLTFAFQEVGLEKGRMVTLHPEMALFLGWGTVEGHGIHHLQRFSSFAPTWHHLLQLRGYQSGYPWWRNMRRSRWDSASRVGRELFQGRGDRQIGGILGGSSQVASG